MRASLRGSCRKTRQFGPEPVQDGSWRLERLVSRFQTGARRAAGARPAWPPCPGRSKRRHHSDRGALAQSARRRRRGWRRVARPGRPTRTDPGPWRRPHGGPLKTALAPIAEDRIARRSALNSRKIRSPFVRTPSSRAGPPCARPGRDPRLWPWPSARPNSSGRSWDSRRAGPTWPCTRQG